MAEPPEPRWVDSRAGVAEVAAACRRHEGLSLDTEADSMHSYFHKVCLVQVTAEEATWLIDPLVVDRRGFEPLLEVLADPGIPVLMHGADYDLRVLDRDFGARVHGLQDTQVMAQLLGAKRTGLAVLLEQELGVELDKRFQRADWGRRPLTRELRQYAAEDTRHLEALVGRLRPRLRERGRWAWVEEECRALEGVRFAPPEPDPLAFERVKGVTALKGAARDRAFTLHRWRDDRARSRDLPPFKILGNRQLVELAAEAPADPAALAAVSGLGPRFARRWGREVLACLERPRPAPPRRPRERPPARSNLEVRRLKAVLAARDVVASELGLEPGLLCARALAEAVAFAADLPLEECGLTGWRLRVLGEPFRQALGELP